MPVPRRIAKARVSSVDVSDFEWGVLTDEIVPEQADGWDGFCATYYAEPGRLPGGPSIGDLWRLHGEAITPEWAEQRAGTRPRAWWRWSAPEPRREVDLDLLEPQAVYLRRLDLFLPGEENRAPPSAWDPEEA